MEREEEAARRWAGGRLCVVDGDGRAWFDNLREELGCSVGSGVALEDDAAGMSKSSKSNGLHDNVVCHSTIHVQSCRVTALSHVQYCVRMHDKAFCV